MSMIATLDEIPGDLLAKELQRRHDLRVKLQCPYCSKKLHVYVDEDKCTRVQCNCCRMGITDNYYRLGQIANLYFSTKDTMSKPAFPIIVCLCGSTKFMTAFYDANMRETLDGKIVLSVGMSSQGDCKPTPEQKIKLDELHKRKIDLAQEVLILNVGGYVGESTKSEVLYAIRHDKKIRWLEDGHSYDWLCGGGNVLFNRRNLVYAFMELPHVIKQEIVKDMFPALFDEIKWDEPRGLGPFFKACEDAGKLGELEIRIDYKNK